MELERGRKIHSNNMDLYQTRSLDGQYEGSYQRILEIRELGNIDVGQELHLGENSLYRSIT